MTTLSVSGYLLTRLNTLKMSNQIVYVVEIRRGSGSAQFPSFLTCNVNETMILCHSFYSSQNFESPVYLKTSLSTCHDQHNILYQNILAIGQFDLSKINVYSKPIRLFVNNISPNITFQICQKDGEIFEAFEGEVCIELFGGINTMHKNVAF